jgi:Protein of unknown function (DUF2815)
MALLIRLENVRLSFPQLFKARKFQDNEDSEPRFEASFLYDVEASGVRIFNMVNKQREGEKFYPGPKGLAYLNHSISKMIEGKWPGKTKGVKICLNDGNDKEYDGYEDMWVISAANKIRPTVVDQKNRPITADDGSIFGGCYVNAVIGWWAQDNKWGKRINCTLDAVQLLRSGEPLGIQVVGAEAFDVVEEEGYDDGGYDNFE